MDRVRGVRRSRLVVVGLTVALVGVHLWLSARITGPSVVFDEAGYLGNARWLAGGHGEWAMAPSPAYASGYPLLVSPLAAVFDAPGTELRAILVANALLLSAVFPLLVVFLRRVVGTPIEVAIAAGLVGALAAPVTAAGVSVIAENLVLPLVVAGALAAWGLTAPGRPAWQRLAYGPVVAALSVTHPRFTLPVVVAVAVLAWGAARRWVAPRVAAANAVLLTALVAAGTALQRAVVDARWQEVERLQGERADWWELATTRRGLVEVADTALGQVWYLAVGSLGLAVIGGLVAVRLVVRSPAAAGEPEPATRSRADHEARRLALGHLLATAGAVFATSVAFFAQNQFRIDHYVYGRHNDSFTPIFVALAVAALARAGADRRGAAIAATVGAAGVVAVTTLVLNARRDPRDFASSYSPFATPAIARPALGDLERAFLAPAFPAIASLLLTAVALTAVARLGPPGRIGTPVHAATSLLVVTLVVVPGAWSVANGHRVAVATEAFAAMNTGGWRGPDDLRRLGVTSLAIDHTVADSRPTLHYPWALPEVDVTTFDGDRAHEQPPGPAVLAAADDERLARAGGRIALLHTNFANAVLGTESGLAVWILPGPLHDRLAERGALLPQGLPGALPPSARVAELTITPQPVAVVPVRSGGRVALTVDVHHAGRGAPWPDHGSYDLAGRVRIVALVDPDPQQGPAGVQGARSGGELPRWMLPGDRAVATVEVVAVDRWLAPLPPGRYRVELAVVQGDPRGDDLWESPGGAPATFVLEVSP